MRIRKTISIISIIVIVSYLAGSFNEEIESFFKTNRFANGISCALISAFFVTIMFYFFKIKTQMIEYREKYYNEKSRNEELRTMIRNNEDLKSSISYLTNQVSQIKKDKNES